ncbi:2,3-bisphosphoglycerate-dependent phosphoglycerate mutase [uncultured archaeon]|nr:2,3-bisphosphoglycerate-dependent phosphoglycerate mutase [uncultured archaeon]
MHRLVALFVRHGSTTLNDSGKFRGPLDVDLDENGKKQGEEVRDLIRTRGLSSAFTSSKKRTKQMADIVLRGRDIGHTERKNLDALNVGEYAGQLKTESNLDAIRYYQRNTDAKIPGGERIKDFQDRVNPEIEAVVKRGKESGVPAIAFVHSSIIHQLGALYHHDHEHVKVKPGGVVGVYETNTGYTAEPLFKEETKDSDVVS